MTVVTRFAPSPTGFLHIGGARTALFNWLFARRHNGKFLLRIEDTDRERSTQEAIDAILEGMRWLELDWDDEPLYQFSRQERHAEVAQQLLEAGKAYYCYTPPQELQELREKARNEGKPFRFDSPWRDRDLSDAPKDVKPVIRLKTPREGATTIEDAVQSIVTVQNAQLDDMVLVRGDGTPTYMLAVVVDDHDMGVTHVIRGDDHLTNAARQTLLYQAMGWNVPLFAHIPLIHGPDGAKLSKRHGALGVEAYRDMGYLPEAMRNYLLRLGWAHGDDEIIPTEQAVEWFDLGGIGKSPSRFDFEKLNSLNYHYLREADNARLVDSVVKLLEKKRGKPAGVESIKRLEKGMDGLKERAKNLKDLADSAEFYLAHIPLTFNEKAEKLLADGGREIVQDIASHYEQADNWDHDNLHLIAKEYAEGKDLKLGKVAQPLRAALTGSNISPSVFEVMEVLGKEESVARLKAV